MAESLCDDSRESTRAAEQNQMILTTGKYLWAEKSNSGSTWGMQKFGIFTPYVEQLSQKFHNACPLNTTI